MRKRLVLPVLAALAMLLCACSTLPTSGDVHTRPDAAASSGEAPYFAPPGPTVGDTPEGVVRGFLLAMQANPPSTAVAREFLSQQARASWKPVQGTIVYGDLTVEPKGDTVVAQLGDAHRLDSRGGWDATTSTDRIELSLIEDDGEWRIDNPPNALAVPATDFSSLFAPYSLYFLDQTGTVLVPTRVYLPRGGPTASNLVRGLLAGPGADLVDVVTSAFPSRTGLDLGVVVDDGLAEVPLGAGVLNLEPDDLDRAMAQLAWTLRQVPGVTRIRITVDDVTVPMPDGRPDFGVREGAEYDPVAAPEREPVALAGRRVVRIAGDEAVPIGGPLGRDDRVLRSVALDADRHRVAAVAANGRRVYLAPDEGARTTTAQVALDKGTDVLRPAFDRFGGLWLVDRTARGAVVHLVDGSRDRVLQMPGITGRRLTAFTLTRDGTRFAATLAGDGNPRLLVAELVRDAGGRVAGVHAAEQIDPELTDLGEVRDIAQDGGSTVAVLTQPARGSGRIVTLELDGSPGEPGSSAPELVPGPVLSFAASPDPDLLPLAVSDDHRLFGLASSGRWIRSAVENLLAVAYPQ